MRCPNCHLGDQVFTIDVRMLKSSGDVRRRRHCQRCQLRWTTQESLVSGPTRASAPYGRRTGPKSKAAFVPPPPEPETLTCSACQQWSTRWQRCAFHFPEASTTTTFASECSNFLPLP